MKPILSLHKQKQHKWLHKCPQKPIFAPTKVSEFSHSGYALAGLKSGKGVFKLLQCISDLSVPENWILKCFGLKPILNLHKPKQHKWLHKCLQKPIFAPTKVSDFSHSEYALADLKSGRGVFKLLQGILDLSVPENWILKCFGLKPILRSHILMHLFTVVLLQILIFLTFSLKMPK